MRKVIVQILKINVVIILLLIGSCVYAQTTIQDLLRTKDWSNVKIDNFSDAEILKYKDYMLSQGITETQAEQIAIQRGLPSSEVFKLKARLANIVSNNNTKSQKNNQAGRTMDSTDTVDPSAVELQKKKENQIFGSEIFNNTNLVFEPNLRIPTPKNYTIGPDDEIAIDLFGYQETNPRLTVSAEGVINIPNVGLVPVNGLTIEQATKRIKDKMAKNGYAGINSGQTQIAVNISKIRSIKITVIGEAKRPGTYTLSSLSTLFNALYTAGGPTDKGSFRTIELIRNNKVVEKLDAYDFLLRGDQTHNVRIMDQDVIRIPVAEVQVALKGEVKRAAIFEVLPNETLADVFNFAGGFSSQAYTAAVHIQQYTDREKQIKDVRKEDFKTYKPQRGDEIEVGKILNKYNNRIILEGAVYRPGKYELLKDMTLSQLIKNADGVKEDAFVERAIVYRINEDLTKQAIAFNVTQLLNGTQADITLKKNDSIFIASIKAFKEEYTLTIDGEVKKPGVYPFYEGITLKDVLFQTGGFTDGAAMQHIEVASRINGDSGSTKKIAQVIEVATESELGLKTNDIKLQPWDVIIVRSKPGYKSQIIVKIDGEVKYPGPYVLTGKEERVSDIIKRAGGLTEQADKSGASITRVNSSSMQQQNIVERVQKLKQVGGADSTQIIGDLSKPTIKVGLDLRKILDDPNELTDVILEEGDVITIPKGRNVVKVNGEVMFPTEVVYKEGASMDYYIGKAGGFSESARKSKVYVLNSNGSASRTGKFLFFKNYPDVNPGSEIIVPRIPDRTGKGLSAAEWIAIASGLASIAGVAVAIVNVSK